LKQGGDGIIGNVKQEMSRIVGFFGICGGAKRPIGFSPGFSNRLDVFYDGQRRL